MRFKQLITNELTEISDETITSLRTYAFYNLSNLERVSLPNLVNVNQYTFSGCSKLKSVNLPKLISSGTFDTRYIFNNCSSLQFVELPSISRIAYCAFSNCTKLKTISTGYNLSLIENNSVSGCSNLNKIVLKANRVVQLSSATALNGTPFKTGNNGGGTAYVPKDFITSYQSDSLWQQIPYVTFLAIEDNLDELEELGVDVSEYNN